MILAAIALGAFVLTIVQASFMEWVFHKYWLHRPWAPKDAFIAHTMIHHQLCKFDDTFHVEEEEQEEALEFQLWFGPLTLVLGAIPWALAAWLFHVPSSILWAFGIPFVLAFVAYYLGFVVFHELMHRPRNSWFERSPFFEFIKKHHRIHHFRMNSNLNVVLPVADFFLRTLVFDVEVPKTTPAAARSLARKHSKFGARIRQDASEGAAAPELDPSDEP